MIKIMNGLPILCDEIGGSQKVNLGELLKLGARLGILINTHSMRGVGKTKTLIQFAKEHDYLVAHPSADYIRKEFDYEKIVNPYVLIQQQGLKNKNVVIDTGVYNLKEIKDAGFNIVTGFCNFKSENIKSFDESIVDNLKSELESLTIKIQKTRENHDFGTYKNLILAYKEVLGLYKESVDIKQDVLNYHIHIDKVISNTEDLGRQIGESLKNISKNLKY
jgi:hypothetical protein